MDAFKTRSSRLVSNAPGRLYRALPAVALGTLFNILDAVSTGLLLFPSEEGTGPTQFKSLQIQGLSMYIMSTILSQVAMTLGGSGFPGALGAMLIEILPFLRGVGSDIRGALGTENPALVPTVMAAYALTSFLTGFVFIVLGLLKLGNLVAYFPQTVLTGAIGAIGLSLFILGLGLMLPETSPLLTLSSAGSVLFTLTHLPLLAASFLPAFFLSLCKRSKLIERWTWGAVHNAYFIPSCLCSIPIVFWIVAGAMHVPMETLITHGWLFRVDLTATQQSGIGTSWIYWREFDFPKVEWWALKHAMTNIILLVVIGVLNLPIFVPALAFSLDVPYDMNREFLGQGAANLLAGVAGTVPNILQYSYSVFITRANGGRFELALVTLLTLVLFFTSSLLLPYVPTVLASALVLFLGMELLLEAVWESAQTLVLLEWSIVMGTLLACTFLGFAEGFGVGIGMAAVVYLVYGVVDSASRVLQLEEWKEEHGQPQQEYQNSIPISPLNHAAGPTGFNLHFGGQDVESMASLVQNHTDDDLGKIDARVILLSGYVFFASIPSLETNLLDKRTQTSFIIVDVTLVHRLETAAAQCFDRAVRDLAPRSTILVLCGVQKGSGVHADFERAGVKLLFNNENASEKGILSFGSRGDSLAWCQSEHEKSIAIAEKGSTDDTSSTTNLEVYQEFCRLFNFRLGDTLGDGRPEHEDEEKPECPQVDQGLDVEKFIKFGARLMHYVAGQSIPRIGRSRIIFIVGGEADVTSSESTPTRPSFSNMLMMLPKESFHFIKRQLFSHRSVRTMGRGDILDCSRGLGKQISVIARSGLSIVEISETQATPYLMSWARGKIEEL